MKKYLVLILAVFLLAGSAIAEGSVIKIKPRDFKDSIVVCNDTDKEFLCYLIITHKGSDKKYRSDTVKIKAYDKEDLDFDYDDEWHDLVKDLKMFFYTPDIDASAYDFEFHFSEEVILDRIQVINKCLMVYVRNETEDF